MIYESIRTYTQLQSLALTIPLITMCLLVVWRIWPHFKSSYKKHSSERTEHDWIIYGITVAFTGKAIDAAWWFVPWSLSYMGHPAWGVFNDAGVFFNLIFRQCFITRAAYCHVRAFAAPEKSSLLNSINTALLVSVIAGQFYPLLLDIIALLILPSTPTQ